MKQLLDFQGKVVIVTSYNFQHRIADPSEIAGVALLLASPMAKFMSGSIVTVDAGQTSH
jgi:NAD(P)-dependent dehydrogenase (short-subunit alcohol dehydrogenase family)